MIVYVPPPSSTSMTSPGTAVSGRRTVCWRRSAPACFGGAGACGAGAATDGGVGVGRGDAARQRISRSVCGPVRGVTSTVAAYLCSSLYDSSLIAAGDLLLHAIRICPSTQPASTCPRCLHFPHTVASSCDRAAPATPHTAVARVSCEGGDRVQGGGGGGIDKHRAASPPPDHSSHDSGWLVHVAAGGCS